MFEKFQLFIGNKTQTDTVKMALEDINYIYGLVDKFRTYPCKYL